MTTLADNLILLAIRCELDGDEHGCAQALREASKVIRNNCLPLEPAPATKAAAWMAPDGRTVNAATREGMFKSLQEVFSIALYTQPSEPAAEYRIPFPLMDSIYETLKFYANLCSYQGERIGGVLKGCPRGPEPTPAQLITHAEDLLQRINREVLGRQSETKE